MHDHDFHMLAKKELHARTRVRLLGMAHLQDGWDYQKIATALRVHEATVHGWMQRFKTSGLDGLIKSPRSSAKRKLDASQEPRFKQLEQQLEVSCCLNSVYNLLARLDLVWITARSKHAKRNQASQDAFKKTSVKW
ncbi:MAG: helix-turn-helix domain-containing protein [Methylobacter sp.]|nr:helix-turn-helix domain-containing protein [Methylobacter sp.]